MSIKQLNCSNCGAKLETKEGQLCCPNCGTMYLSKNDINNTYITNNENIVKNFYGSATSQEFNNEKINGFLIRAIDDFESELFSESKNWCMRIFAKDPLNEDAIILKSLIQKGSNGRFSSPNFDTYINALEKLLSNNNYKKANMINSLLLNGLRKNPFSYRFEEKKVRNIITKLEESDLNNKQDFIDTLTNSLRQAEINEERINIESKNREISRQNKKIAKIIIATIVVLGIIIGIIIKTSQPIPTNYTTTYYSSTGGYVRVDNTNYSEYYSYTLKEGSDSINVLAQPQYGFIFTNWSDGISTANRQDINVRENISVTAYFAPDGNTFSINYTAETGGSITGTTSQSVRKNNNGTSVTAIANFGYFFTSWSDGITTQTRQDINIQSNISVTANFERYFSNGEGKLASPFEISTAQQLKNLSEIINTNITSTSGNYKTAYYSLINDVDLSLFDCWVPIGNFSNGFSGKFNGNNHTISNLTITNSTTVNHLGVFGYCYNAEIQNVIVSSIDINIAKDGYFHCGAIVGRSENCSITNCSSNGTITINSNGNDGLVVAIGGIAGLIQDTTITFCSSTIIKSGQSTGNNPPEVTKVFIGEIYGWLS